MTGYFAAFPNTVWSNTVCLDITRRTGITRRFRAGSQGELTQCQSRNFYPMTVPDGIRADRAAQAYYGDPYQAWLVYVSANIIDPYYDWLMDVDTFNNYITAKYGTTLLAQQKIYYWSVNWVAFSDATISPSFYTNTLDEHLKKYYEPIFGLGTTVLAYRLRRVDWTETTNQFVGMNLANTTSGNGFILDEPVYVRTAGNTVQGNAQVCWLNSNTPNQVVVQHVTGNVTANNASLYGVVSQTSANIVSEAPAIYNIPLNEQAFWSPISYFQYEIYKNEQHRQVKVVDVKYAGQAQTDLNNLLRPNTALQGVMPFLKTLTTTSSSG